jgi:hypothetical protein
LRIFLSTALLLQLGFQTETVLGNWINTRPYTAADLQNPFRNGPEQIEYVSRGPRLQGEFIAPTRGVIDCYDMDDFVRADIDPGRELVRRVLSDWQGVKQQLLAQARFLSWNRIQVEVHAASTQTVALRTQPVQVVLNQAFHPLWRATGCDTLRHARGNLIIECPLARWQQGPVELTFHNELSQRAAQVSTLAWRVWAGLGIGLLGLLVGVLARRTQVPSFS